MQGTGESEVTAKMWATHLIGLADTDRDLHVSRTEFEELILTEKARSFSFVHMTHSYFLVVLFFRFQVLSHLFGDFCVRVLRKCIRLYLFI